MEIIIIIGLISTKINKLMMGTNLKIFKSIEIKFQKKKKV